MSEIFDKSQMSETIDVPAGCYPWLVNSSMPEQLDELV